MSYLIYTNIPDQGIRETGLCGGERLTLSHRCYCILKYAHSHHFCAYNKLLSPMICSLDAHTDKRCYSRN